MHAVAQENSAVSDGRRELTDLLSGCGLFRPDMSLFSISGRDRARWLNGMITNNVRDLAPGHGIYAFVLNPQGHILGDLYVFNRGESLTVEIERAQVETLVPLLKRYIIMDKVEIQDLSGQTAMIGIIGPRSFDVLTSVGLNKDLEPLQFAECEWKGTSTTLIRSDNPCVPSFQLLVPAEKAESLTKALGQAGAETVSQETLETLRILCGIPKIGQDIRERTLPQETGQDRALNYTKGCYIGQEIVERIRARGAVHRTFVGFEIDGTPPSAGTKIQSDGRDVGELTTIAAAPLRGKQLALGFLRKEFCTEDKVLTAGQAKVRSAPLPLLDRFINAN